MYALQAVYLSWAVETWSKKDGRLDGVVGCRLARHASCAMREMDPHVCVCECLTLSGGPPPSKSILFSEVLF